MNEPDEVTRRIAELKLIPVVAMEDANLAPALAGALLAGGLPIAEVTFRTAAAEATIEALAQVEDLLVGAGTVINVDQADRAVAAGARFVVSPGLDAATVRWCQERGVAVYPGVATPTEVMAAMALGLEVVKLFPAETLGGVRALKALAGPFPRMKFIPTGGVSTENVVEWLAHPSVLACGGSWMVAKKLLASGDFVEVTRRVRGAVDLAE